MNNIPAFSGNSPGEGLWQERISKMQDIMAEKLKNIVFQNFFH